MDAPCGVPSLDTSKAAANTVGQRVLVIGLGSIGRRHLRNLKLLGCEVAVLRRTESAAAESQRELGVLAFHDPSAAEAWAPRFVIVANVTSKHLSSATWAVRQGCHVLVEKPLANSREGVDEFLRLADANRCCVAVGCNLRFHPALESIHTSVHNGDVGRLLTARCEVGYYLPDWHPTADYRLEYSSQAALGGGALQTLIHELDYMMWIAGPVSEAVGRRARVSNLEIDVEDVVELICRHSSGALTSVHMDFVDRVYNRRSRWIGESGSIEWQWDSSVVLLRPDGSKHTLWDKQTFAMNDTYLRELIDFFEAAFSRSGPRTSAHDACRVLDVALTVPVA